jgi:phospholipid/cholesterol/gamma-HCH transport system substrate-binding protein
MRRLLATVLIVVACTGLVVVGTAGSDAGGNYQVRAVFDNGGFIVPGEDVRVAGANVGSVESVDVTGNDETASLQGGAHPVPGKAVVVLKITDSGFQDFKRDASCLIRPQSLIGEKYVDCQVTAPHAPESQSKVPSLQKIPDGQPGAGQYLLPLENNGKAVDLDLVNNIQRLPFAERFRLIINDLGAALAARGPDLAAVVRRADPALRQFDRVLAILAAQNKALAKLQSDSDTILAPLARERAHVAGFIDTAGETAAASAERSADIERGLQKFPRTLRELRLTMRALGGFSRAATPVTANFGKAAPSLTVASRNLAPFATATTLSLRSLGNAAEQAGPLLVQGDPTIRRLRDLARSGARPATNLARLLKSLRQTKGFEHLMSFLYNNVGWANGFDQFGHLLRQNLLATNCIDYATVRAAECQANWRHATSTASAARTPRLSHLRRLQALTAKPDRAKRPQPGGAKPLDQPTRTAPRPSASGADGGARGGARGPGAGGSARDVLEYLLGQ